MVVSLLKLPLKLLALPVALAVTIAKWIGVFLTSFAGVLFYIFSGLCFVLAILSYLMGIRPAQKRSECWRLGLWRSSCLSLLGG